MMIAAVLGLMPGIASQAAAKPLKVFILAGQSNMQDHAKVSTFQHIGMDPATKPMLAEKYWDRELTAVKAKENEIKQLKKTN